MSFVYLGFNTHQMLCWLEKYCTKVELAKTEDGWLISIVSDDFGKSEYKGSLSRVISQAFKPFIEKAKKDKAEAKSLLELAIDK